MTSVQRSAVHRHVPTRDRLIAEDNPLRYSETMRLPLATLLLVGLFTAACDTPPVEWSDPTTLAGPSTVGPTRLAFSPDGSPQLVPDSVVLASRPSDPAL